VNYDVIAGAIVEECLDPLGFLVLLHSYNQFDHQRWNQLKAQLAAYSAALQSNAYMHRRVAGCLLAIENELLNHLTAGASSANVSLLSGQVEQAYTELEPLLNAIFWE
jgi:hypothetical protein